MRAKNNLNFVFGSVQYRIVRNYYLVNIEYKINIKNEAIQFIMYGGGRKNVLCKRIEKI